MMSLLELPGVERWKSSRSSPRRAPLVAFVWVLPVNSTVWIFGDHRGILLALGWLSSTQAPNLSWHEAAYRPFLLRYRLCRSRPAMTRTDVPETRLASEPS